jgi:membrane fusion protein, macrolide-specific efflux system
VYYNALFDVPNEDGKLRIDMTAQVYIVLADAKNALTIPAAAIQTQRGNRSAKGGQGNRSSDQAKKTDADKAQRPKRLELSEEEKALVAQGKASTGMVRVLQADGTAQPQPVLIGLNNRVTAQVLKGLKQGDQVVIADASDSSNEAAKRSNQRAMRM